MSLIKFYFDVEPSLLATISRTFDETFPVILEVSSRGFGLYFYTTFFTSIWLWLYGISGFFIKGLNKTKSGLRFFNKYFDIDKQPLSAMGFLLIIIITACYLIGGVWLVVSHYIL